MAKLQAKKPIRVSRRPIKVKAVLKANPKPKKQKVTPITTLKRNAWEQFSRYIRLRDTDYIDDGWYGTCITCSKTGKVAYIDEKAKLRYTTGWDAGHYISRGNWFLRHDEENVNLQCSFRCNKMRSGEHQKYKLALDLKYGDGTHKKLDMLAAVNPAHKPTRQELEEVVTNSKTSIDFYKGQAL